MQTSIPGYPGEIVKLSRKGCNFIEGWRKMDYCSPPEFKIIKCLPPLIVLETSFEFLKFGIDRATYNLYFTPNLRTSPTIPNDQRREKERSVMEDRSERIEMILALPPMVICLQFLFDFVKPRF